MLPSVPSLPLFKSFPGLCHEKNEGTSNLRSCTPSLYLEAGKEGMIHLLVGSYVQKPDSGFFSDWLRNNTKICCLLISCHISIRLLARSWSENGMVQKKQVYARTSFFFCLSWSSRLRSNFNYNSLKAECCSGENALAFLSAGFLKTTKVLECHKFPCPTLG